MKSSFLNRQKSPMRLIQRDNMVMETFYTETEKPSDDLGFPPDRDNLSDEPDHTEKNQSIDSDPLLGRPQYKHTITTNSSPGMRPGGVACLGGQGFFTPGKKPSVRSEIESRLLQEICQSRHDPLPGLFERHRRNFQGKPAMSFWSEESPLVSCTTTTSPLISTINANYRLGSGGSEAEEDVKEENLEKVRSRGNRGKRRKKRRRVLPPGIDQLDHPSARLESRKSHRSDSDRARRGRTKKDIFFSDGDRTNSKEMGNRTRVNSDLSKDACHLSKKYADDLHTPDCSNVEGPYSSCGEDSREEVLRRIRSYNRSMTLEAFHIKTSTEEEKGEFQGALRFYLENGQHQVSKALKLRNTTTVRQLLPLVVDKFNLTPHLEEGQENSSRVRIFQRRPDGEIPLEDDDRPLSLALTSRCRPRFLVRLTRTQEEQVYILMSDPAPGDNPQGPGERPRRHRQGHRRKSKHRKHDVVLDSLSVDDYGFGEEAHGGGHRAGCYESDGGTDTSIMNITSREEVSSRSGRSRWRREKKEGYIKDKEGRKRESSLDRISSQLSLRKGSLRLSRSMTNLVQKTFSLRQKDSLVRRQPELSTEDSAPGVLKIFGSSISPGAEYKSVLATLSSTARELIKEALERYNISRRQARHYVLCDVIGRFVTHGAMGAMPEVASHAPRHFWSTTEGVWMEECVRIVGDNERPLTIQTFWKPSQEHSRRFEIRKRSDMVASVDTVTSGINANARRMLLTKTRLHAVPGLVCPRPQGVNPPDSTDEGVTTMTEGQVDSTTQVDLQPRTLTPPPTSPPDQRTPLRPPPSHPYFITLRGNDSHRDSLMYVLAERVTMVGSGRGQMGEGDICLHAPDILPEHCWLSQSIDPQSGTVLTSLDPLPTAPVRINGNPADGTVTLAAGDVVYVGDHYAFLYKAAQESDQGGQLDLTHVRQSLEDAPQSVLEESELPCSMLKWRKDRSDPFETDQARLRLAYLREKEDGLLDSIVTYIEKHPHAPKLTTAYLTCMCVEHSIDKFGPTAARDLLSKFSNVIQVTVWEATKVLADTQANVKHDRQTHIDDLLPELQPVSLWLSNAVELHYFFRRSVRDSLRQSGAGDKDNDGDASPEEEIVVVLEDVVMYSFQQTVYYLTKALYPILPAVLDGNPFTAESPTSGDCPPGPTVEGLVHILQSTLATLTHLQLHPNILSQLFCYLFFFTSTSLFNLLMAKDAGTKFYKWSRGVRIRGNLDAVESWAAASGLGEEAGIYLSKINTLANLLATPRLQLLTANWQSLRRDFPELNGEQLLKVLSEYELGPYQEQPEGWAPPEGAVDTANWSCRLTESFSDHPPLRLPKTGFRVDLRQPNPDEELCDVIHRLTSEFGASDDDGDSGLSVSQTLPVFTDIPQSPVYIAGSGDESKPPFDDSALDLPPYPRLSSPVACRAGTLDCSSATCPVPPKRRSKHERHRGSLGHAGNQSGVTGEASTATDMTGSKAQEPDLGDSGISMSGEQKDMRAEEHRLVKLDFEGPTSSPCNKESRSYGTASLNRKGHRAGSKSPPRHGDISNGHREGSRSPPRYRDACKGHRENSRSPPRYRDPSKGHRGDSRSPPRYRDASTKPPDHLSPDFPYTGPLAISSPVSSDSTPCPSPVDDSKIPPQPKTPAPTLDRASIKRRQRPGSSRRERAAGEAEDKVVEVNYLLPTSPDGVVNGLRVLPLPAEMPATNGDEDLSDQEQTYFLRTIQSKIGTTDSLDEEQPEEKSEVEEEVEDVFVVDLVKGVRGLGLGLIDGMFTPLRRPGIYVRTLVPSEPAAVDGRLQIGDRILAVNGQTVVGADYQSAMKTIRDGGQFLQFLVAQGNRMITMQITASSC